ncbi:hypothetical protein GCM10020000_85880 [Streptomyces olivoverticillatus]
MRLLPVAMRYVHLSELDLLATAAGLGLTHRYADWNRAPLTVSSTQHISVYTPPPEPPRDRARADRRQLDGPRGTPGPVAHPDLPAHHPPTGPDTDALAAEILTREHADTSRSLGVFAARKSAPPTS